MISFKSGNGQTTRRAVMDSLLLTKAIRTTRPARNHQKQESMEDATVNVAFPDTRRIFCAVQQLKNGVAHQSGELYE